MTSLLKKLLSLEKKNFFLFLFNCHTKGARQTLRFIFLFIENNYMQEGLLKK